MSQKSKQQFAKLYGYENILLSVYIDIAKTGDVSLLVISGQMDRAQLVEKYEEIVKKNGEQNGDFRYDAYFQLMKGYAELLAQYTIVKALLMKASLVLDYETITEIRRRGFKINLDSTEKYAESLYAASRRVDNLVTKARSKQKEMEGLQGHGQESVEYNFETIIANLNFGLGFSVNEGITLARYNAYKKIIKMKAEQKRQVNKLAHG